MSVPNTPRAYDDCYEVFDRALKDEVGVKVRVKDNNAGQYFRMRLNQARSINRKENMRTYEMGHPMFNASQYDCLVCTVEFVDGDCYVFVQRRPIPLEIVPLSGEAAVEEEPAFSQEVDAEPVDDFSEAVVVSVTPGPRRV